MDAAPGMLYKYAPMHISTCPRPSSMFSSRQSKCSRVCKYVNVLVVSRWQLFACLTLQSYNEN
jgi:hypothetical protein